MAVQVEHVALVALVELGVPVVHQDWLDSLATAAMAERAPTVALSTGRIGRPMRYQILLDFPVDRAEPEELADLQRVEKAATAETAELLDLVA
jgi:hypothetical protein